jgi:hypothetical protein
MSEIQRLIEKYPMHQLGYNTLIIEVNKVENNLYPYFTYTGSMILMKEIIVKIKSLIDQDKLDETIDYCKYVMKTELNSIFENRAMISETTIVRQKILEICAYLLDDIQSCKIALKNEN